MRILFCNITWLKYYKGIYPGVDEPYAGGAYVKKTGDALEKFNFEAVDFPFPPAEHLEPGKYCLGFTETGSTSSQRKPLQIEKIDGCKEYAGIKYAEDVLVVFCAKNPAYGHLSIVGWYKHATVYRDYQEQVFGSEEEPFYQEYNIIAKAEDCVLLPLNLRSRKVLWEAPKKSDKGFPFGFSRLNVWYGKGDDNDPRLDGYLNKIIKQIDEYDGDNWLDKYPEL